MTNILVVDDTDVDLLLMERLLSSPDFTVVLAGDGLQALEKLKDWNIDLILTDLQMPKMNGLELVRKVHELKLNIPVILTTGRGSEEIAAEALKAGAAGYIPKSKLNLMLVPTVKETLNIIHSDVSYSRLIDYSKGSRFKFELPSDPSLLPEVVDFCERMLHSTSTLDRISRLRIAIAVDQALQNALYRGNLEIGRQHKIGVNGAEMPEIVRRRLNSESYRDRKIRIAIEIKPTGFGICIQDDGPGFDTASVGSWDEPSLRGIILMKSFMDSVTYNDKGNMVEMKCHFGTGIPDRAVEGRPVRPSAKIVCQATQKAWKLDSEKLVIGRRSGCHLQLKSEDVAPLHCSLNFHRGNWVLRSLTNNFKTLINGKPIQRAKLASGDVISIGDQTFKFQV